MMHIYLEETDESQSEAPMRGFEQTSQKCQLPSMFKDSKINFVRKMYTTWPNIKFIFSHLIVKECTRLSAYTRFSSRNLASCLNNTWIFQWSMTIEHFAKEISVRSTTRLFLSHTIHTFILRWVLTVVPCVVIHKPLSRSVNR